MNWIGLKTLYLREVKRFIKVFNQTLLAPMVNALLLLSVFSLAVGNRVTNIQDVDFSTFLACGLIMMTMVQNAFANTSSSLIMSKVLGFIGDIITPPLSPTSIVLALSLAGITRGVITGMVVVIAVMFFVPLGIHNIWLTIYFAVMASLLLAMLGIFAGIFADSFDQMSAITNFVITPLSFLSGTFYSVKNLPEFWQTVNQFNPFFYMIDGFRYSLTGHTDTNITTGIFALLAANIIVFLIVNYLLNKGYRIKQ